MRQQTILAICVISVSLPITTLAQLADRVQNAGARDSPAEASSYLALFEALFEGDGTCGEPILLPAEFEVAREEVKFAQSNLEHALSDAEEAEPVDILTKAASLAERLEAWFKIGQQLGGDSPDLKPLQRLLAEIDVEIAAIEAARARRVYEKTIKADPPFLQRILVLQHQLDLAEDLIDLSKRQVTFLDQVAAGHGKTVELNDVLEQLRKRHEHLLDDLGDTVEKMDFDAIVSLIDNATLLIARAETFVKNTGQLIDGGASREAIDLADSLLALSRKLLRRDSLKSGDEEPDAKLRTLMVRRLALLREENRRIKRSVVLQIAGIRWQDMLSNSELVLKAELELCKTRAERLARYRNHVKWMRQIEKKMAEETKKVIAGGATEQELRQVQIWRLTAEIELQRELIHTPTGDNASAPQGDQ